MFGFLRRSPVKQMQKDHAILLTRAFQAQRNGDIRKYSLLTAEAEALREKIESLEEGHAD
tara:strand:+ start:13414 stop:13593 length:180 start_codon:yes stop_codon:yes gene_type:complete